MELTVAVQLGVPLGTGQVLLEHRGWSKGFQPNDGEEQELSFLPGKSQV